MRSFHEITVQANQRVSILSEELMQGEAVCSKRIEVCVLILGIKAFEEVCQDLVFICKV